MTFAGEVLHVLKKDVRQARLLTAIYLALALLAAVSAASGVGSDLADSASGVLPVVLILLGAVLVGSAVQEDSPVRATAFWPTRPLRPGAVAGAKLLLALLVVLAAVAAQALALAWLRVSWPEAARLTLVPALRLAVVVLAAAFVAAATRSLGQFVAWSLVLGVAVLTLGRREPVLVVLPDWLRLLLPLVLLGAVLATQYRRRAVLGATVAGVAVVLLGGFVRSPESRLSLPVPGPAPVLPAASAEGGPATLRRLGRPRSAALPSTYQLQLPADWLPRDLLLRSATLVAAAADGPADTLAQVRPQRMVGAFLSGEEALTFVLNPEAADRLRLAPGVVVALELAVLRASPFGAVGARAGSRSGGPYPLQVLEASVAEGRARLKVSTAGVSRLGGNVRRMDYGFGLASHEFSLVTPGLAAPVRMFPVQGSAVSRTVVLPGANLLREALVLEAEPGTALTADRLQQSRLTVSHWSPARSARAALPVRVVE